MSLLHRWSLPSRSLAREKPQDDEPSDQSRFPTVHIGQAVPRRRTNISSAFSTLFEKPENRQKTRKLENHSEATDSSPLLAPRRIDVSRDINPKYLLAHGEQNTTTPGASSSKLDGKLESATRRSEVEADEAQHCPSSEPSNRTGRVTGKSPKFRSFSLSSTESNEAVDRGEPPFLMRTNQDCVRVRSASSSYPSEGMRSPGSGPCSPKLVATNPGTDPFAEYRRFGHYPSRASWIPFSAPMSKASLADAAGGESIRPTVTTTTTTTAQDGFTSDQENSADQTSNLEISPFADPPESQEGSSPSDMGSRRESSVLYGGNQQPKLLSSNQFIPSISGIDNVLYFPSGAISRECEDLGAQSTSSRDDYVQHESDSVGSIQHLRSSTDTENTMSTTVRRCSIFGSNDEDDSWSTIPDSSGEKPTISHRSSWTQLFALSTSNGGSSITLAQRLRQLKLRIWAKRVVFKTKARLKLVGRSVPTTTTTVKRAAASLKQRHGLWRPKLGGKNKKKNKKKRSDEDADTDTDANKNNRIIANDECFNEKKENKKMKKGRKERREKKKRTTNGGATETPKATKKQARQHKEAANRVFDTLFSKRAASLQLGMGTGMGLSGSIKSSSSRKLSRHHARVGSTCPNDV